MNHRLRQRLVFLILTGSFLCQIALAQQKADFRSGAVKTSCGYLLVWNEEGNNYTLRIEGSDVRQISTEDVRFSVDGIFLEVLTPTVKSFLNDKPASDARAILAAHRDWEVAYLEGEYKSKLTIESFPQKLASGEEALLWQFDVPASAKSNVRKQVYVTVVKGDHLLALGSVVTDTISEKSTHRLLLWTATSLRSSSQPTDLAKIQELLRTQ